MKDWDDKDLPFVGWTFKRFEEKGIPSETSIFQGGNTEEVDEGKKSPAKGKKSKSTKKKK